MNIQAKFKEINDAAHNMGKLIEGMSGLREALVPKEELERISLECISPVLAHQDNTLNHTLELCRQEIGEAVQVCQSIEARLRNDIDVMKAELAELRESVDGIIDAVSSKKRRGRA